MFEWAETKNSLLLKFTKDIKGHGNRFLLCTSICRLFANKMIKIIEVKIIHYYMFL